MVGNNASCVLRRLRICSEQQGNAVSITDASPLLEGCELVGRGGEPVRGARAGMTVRGSCAWPVVRGCRVLGHAGAGLSFSKDAGGIVVACDISRCACGIWLDGGSDPLIWKNTISGHRGAGIVVRADGLGRVMWNAVLRNGAGGILVESSRRATTVIAQNRVWANMGCDLRQSPAGAGRTASEVGTLFCSNAVGQQEDPAGGVSLGSELKATWPKQSVHTAQELAAAVKCAPIDRYSFIEIQASVQLHEALVLDRPVVLTGRPGSRAELQGAPGAAAAVLIVPGGEAASLWCVMVKLQAHGKVSAGASCVEITAGRPSFIDCDFDASWSGNDTTGRGLNGQMGDLMVTHAVRATGIGVAPLLAGCAVHNAIGTGIMLDEGASALLLHCEVSANRQGGVFLGDGSSLLSEQCGVSSNGHFGIIVGPSAGHVYLGRTNFSSNSAGSVWHCGVGAEPPRRDHVKPLPRSLALPLISTSQVPLWFDQCSLGVGGHTPPLVIGYGATAVIWEGLSEQQLGRDAIVRTEASSRVVLASEGAGPAALSWFGQGSNSSAPDSPNSAGTRPVLGGGEAVWLDISGAVPSGHGNSFGGPLQTWAPLSPDGAQQDGDDSSDGFARDASEAVPSTQGDMTADSPDGIARELSLASLGQSAGDPGTPTGDGTSGQADEHVNWLRSMMTTGEKPPVNESSRRRMFELVSMLAQKARCEDIVDVVGLGGQLKKDDHVVLRVHSGCWIGAAETEIICNVPDRSLATKFVLETKGPILKDSHRTGFRVLDESEPDAAASNSSNRCYRLGITNTHEVKALPRNLGAKDAETNFQVLSDTKGPIVSGTAVYIKSTTGRMLFVDGESLRTRTSEKGHTLERIIIEKTPDASELPPPSPEHELSVLEKAWLLRRGVQHSLVDKKELAKFLAGHKPGSKELLQAYTKLWESEWRLSWPNELPAVETAAEDSGGSPANRSDSAHSGAATDRQQPRSHTPRARGRRQGQHFFFRGGSPEDKRNGELFVSAMRSFFSTAIYMAQLEADPVQRVIEAFAEVLTNDKSFLDCFEASMLPEKERRDYRTPEEVLFGLTYTTIMLQTDLHNKQVASKTWDKKKFEGAGKQCGVTPGLMSQIFKHVQKEPL